MFDGENEYSDEESVSPKAVNPLEPRSELERDGESREERDARLRALRRKSGPQVLAEYQQYKGRGRYAAGLPKYVVVIQPFCVILIWWLELPIKPSIASLKLTRLRMKGWRLSLTQWCGIRMSGRNSLLGTALRAKK
jgi:hypothetical protein